MEMAGVYALDFTFGILADDMRLMLDKGRRVPDVTENDGYVLLLEENVCPRMLDVLSYDGKPSC